VRFSFTLKSIWRNEAPLRVAFFVWIVALCKILTLANLRKGHVIVIDVLHVQEDQGIHRPSFAPLQSS
jgi:hypothetical protein